MIEVVRHTSDFQQFASSLYMDSSVAIPNGLYGVTGSLSQPTATDEDIKHTYSLLQISFKCDQGMDGIKAEEKQFIKKRKHGSKLVI
ncbi:unnamed protein product [Litomosoides sigmodontis]|uniref:Uncharacterized protein n=1 Tax=Litomosoides sigmodontis TaxID=42156 RepID=A0A3P6U294_LITSI|nr:unnamed protein product [Litomosoides sigmodontis]